MRAPRSQAGTATATGRLAHAQNLVREIALEVEQRLLRKCGEGDHILGRKEVEAPFADLRLAGARW